MWSRRVRVVRLRREVSSPITISDGPVLLTVLNIAFSGATFAVGIAVLVNAFKHWGDTKRQFARAAPLVGIAVGLGLPSVIVSILHLDPAGPGQTDYHGALRVVMQGAARFSVLVTVAMSIGFMLIEIPVAARLGEPHPFPLLFRRPEGGQGLVIGLCLGEALGALTVVVFHRLGVGPGPLLEMSADMLPGVDVGSHGYALGVRLPGFLSVAVSEELLYRGVIQRFIERKLGSKRRHGWVAIVLASAFWATGHIANSDQVGVKLAQIFVVGLVFGWLARRFSVEASIAAHMGINLVAVVVPILLRLLGI